MLRILQNLFGGKSGDGDAGSQAERLAADWLRGECGYKIVATNWRNPRDLREELDLICRDGDALVFVEVKARAANALVRGYFAVNRRKKRVMLSAAKAYLLRLNPKPRTFRCDVVEIELPAAREKTVQPIVRHYVNVPLFGKHYLG